MTVETTREASHTGTGSKADITVLTCTIPGRENYLDRCIDSVRRQTVGVRAHLIASDDGTLGPIEKYNQLARAVDTEWLAILDDDNYWLDEHAETIAAEFDNADVIYTWDGGGTRPRIQLAHFEQVELAKHFAETNSVDQSCAIRTETFLSVGGFQLSTRLMDQDLWYRIAQAGGRFLAIPNVTWFYSLRTIDAMNAAQ